MPDDIRGVTVRDASFKTVKELVEPGPLREFSGHWSRKARAEPPPGGKLDWAFKLDVRGASSGDRWLYDAAGFVVLLSKQEQPVHRIEDRDAFNALIGAS